MFLKEANSKVLEKPKSPWKMIGDMCEVGEGAGGKGVKVIFEGWAGG